MTLAPPIDLRVPYSARCCPPHVAKFMCDVLGIKETDTVLEPSAGAGSIVREALTRTSLVTAIELGQSIRQLQKLTPHAYKRNFLALKPDSDNISARGLPCRLGKFDKIVMCPPANSDSHIDHARKFLKPDGKLLALVLKPHIVTYLPQFLEATERYQINGEDITAGYVYMDKGRGDV